MNQNETLEIAKHILWLAGVDDPPPLRSFLEYGQIVAEAAKALTKSQREHLQFDLKDWAKSWRKLYDDFDRALLADPMLAYEPAHHVALEFHQSTAAIRYFCTANRCAKTQTGFAEHYFVATGQHRWRRFAPPPTASCLIGTDFNTYATSVFETKFISGESDNPLAPMFPEGGKWFYHYDPRKHVLQIACQRCAEQGKAGSCPHPKSIIRCLSDERGWEVLEGAQYNLIQFDEHIEEGFFGAAKQRLKTVSFPSLIVTGTPLFGRDMWEQVRLKELYDSGPPRNLSDPNNPDSPLLVSFHHIDQFEAGLVPHDKIREDMASMDEYEIEARIYGRASEVATNPVFDKGAIAKMVKSEPQQVTLDPKEGDITFDFKRVRLNYPFKVTPDKTSSLRVWKEPEANGTYILGVDTAAGLTDGDASCASMCRAYMAAPGQIGLELVAQWHGKINQLDFAPEVMKMACWYNGALVAIELTGGYGRPVMQRLKDEFFYWNLYREKTDVAMLDPQMDSRFGVETNAQTKGAMVSALQYMVKHGLVQIPCQPTLQEMRAFEQEKVGAGGSALLTPRFKGTKGYPDDRVMSMVICASVAQAYKPLHFKIMATAPAISQNTNPYTQPKIPDNLEVAKFWEAVNNDVKSNQQRDPFDI